MIPTSVVSLVEVIASCIVVLGFVATLIFDYHIHFVLRLFFWIFLEALVAVVAYAFLMLYFFLLLIVTGSLGAPPGFAPSWIQILSGMYTVYANTTYGVLSIWAGAICAMGFAQTCCGGRIVREWNDRHRIPS